jgi:hypothetical protein
MTVVLTVVAGELSGSLGVSLALLAGGAEGAPIGFPLTASQPPPC